MNTSSSKAPWHLWVVGILALLWNAMGGFDYIATQTQMESYMSQFTQEQLDYFYAFPAWMSAAWAIGVWGSVLGSIALLMRKSWAVWLFGLSIIGLAVSTVYNAMSGGFAIMGQTGTIFTGVIWLIIIALFLYSRSMASKGVLS